MPRKGIALLLLTLLGGCARVDRTVTVTSDPDGALVFLNDQEIGRTPVTRNFKWYGTYDVEVRQEGYQTLKTTAPIIAKWWQVPPIDLIIEFIPARFEDHRELHYFLSQPADQEVDPALLVRRGEQLKTRLESGQRTKVPETRPTTRPLKRSTTQVSPATATSGATTP